MTETVYDRHAAFYVDFVDQGQARPNGVRLVLATLVDCLGGRLAGARVLDLCCGEGWVGRELARSGAREVTGIDLSAALIDVARERADSPALAYRVDDAQTLASARDGAFDVVVCQLALMDVPDHRALFAATRRVLRANGAFVFSILHPCFEGRPFHFPEAPPFLLDDAGAPTACVVRRYATEGHWESGGTGVRGHMGAWHRTLSTYVNDLIRAGFVLERLEEPLAADATGEGLFAEIPSVMVISARAR
jgi:2-polyprenyl-3-methyl-5-hydroxy-6-metoxy-1,4-benzoquinol methylase